MKKSTDKKYQKDYADAIGRSDFTDKACLSLLTVILIAYGYTEQWQFLFTLLIGLCCVVKSACAVNQHLYLKEYIFSGVNNETKTNH